jgi:hypothetical protein
VKKELRKKIETFKVFHIRERVECGVKGKVRPERVQWGGKRYIV